MEEREDLTIYYPLKCNGKYEPTAYSFNGSIKAFSEPKDAFNFIKKSYLTEEECQQACDKLNSGSSISITKADKDLLFKKIDEITPAPESCKFEYYDNGYNDGCIGMAEKIKNMIEAL